jgi:hypothetical protein
VFTVGAKRYSDIRPANLLWLCLGIQLLGRKEEIKESRLNEIRRDFFQWEIRAGSASEKIQSIFPAMVPSLKICSVKDSLKLVETTKLIF